MISSRQALIWLVKNGHSKSGKSDLLKENKKKHKENNNLFLLTFSFDENIAKDKKVIPDPIDDRNIY